MPIIAILKADDVADADDVAPTKRSTPHGSLPGGVAGYTWDGAAYCVGCAPDVTIPFNGTVSPEAEAEHDHDDDGNLLIPMPQFPPGAHDPRGFGVGVVEGTDEWDYPGATCHECGDVLDTNVLVYDEGGAHPDPVVEVSDPDGMGEYATAFLLERDGDTAKVMLAEDFGQWADAGDTSWIPQDDLIDD